MKKLFMFIVALSLFIASCDSDTGSDEEMLPANVQVLENLKSTLDGEIYVDGSTSAYEFEFQNIDVQSQFRPQLVMERARYNMVENQNGERVRDENPSRKQIIVKTDENLDLLYEADVIGGCCEILEVVNQGEKLSFGGWTSLLRKQ